MNKERAALRAYSGREWRIAALVGISYAALHYATSICLPLGSFIDPALAISIAGVYFGGRRLWPAVLAAALFSELLIGASVMTAVALSLATTLSAVVTAHLLHVRRVDPLFRRHHDIFSFLIIVIVASAITPTLLLPFDAQADFGSLAAFWWRHFVATLFSILIVAPFLLRWFAKRHFSRTPLEVAETLGVFTALVGIDAFLFAPEAQTVGGIPLFFFLFLPLFWIALRLRPRFMTLAILITAVFAVMSALTYATPETVLEELLRIEIHMIVLAMAFFVITTLEEDRRANMNLLRSQMATLKNAMVRISSESRAKNEFIAILAHELRNPLAPVVSSIDILKLRGARDAEEEEIYAVMEDRMNIVRKLLDDLLDISRISEGKIMLERVPLDLAPVIYRAVLSTDHHRRELHQRLIFKSADAPLYVLGDALRLEQVFSNLLTNASKYSSSGDTIGLYVRVENGMALIEVTDQGIGIRPEEREAIFLPFYQTEETGRGKKGLGIGLSLVRNFVEHHSGTIEALSDGPGSGSRFVVRLPLITAPVRMTRNPEVVKVAETVEKGLRMLVVDDNDAAAAAIGRILEIEGCDVRYAYTGEQAITLALQHAPDAIFLDIGLPDQDGYSVAKTIRTRGYGGRIIALSGYNMDAESDRWRDAGFDRYLVKPAGLADLRTVIADLKQLAKYPTGVNLSLEFPPKQSGRE